MQIQMQLLELENDAVQLMQMNFKNYVVFLKATQNLHCSEVIQIYLRQIE